MTYTVIGSLPGFPYDLSSYLFHYFRDQITRGSCKKENVVQRNRFVSRYYFMLMLRIFVYCIWIYFFCQTHAVLLLLPGRCCRYASNWLPVECHQSLLDTMSSQLHLEKLSKLVKLGTLRIRWINEFMKHFRRICFATLYTRVADNWPKNLWDVLRNKIR